MMVPMQPGKDGKPWFLCPPCYEEGRTPFKLGMIKQANLIPATDPEPNAAKDDVGDFNRPKERSPRRRRP